MSMNRKVFLIILFSAIILVAGILFVFSNLSKDNKQEAIIKTDREAIINRFPNIGDFKKCYWKADLMGGEDSGRVPGPSGYWIKGFVEIDDDKINYFIEKYDMKELDEDLQFDFLPENYDNTISKWFFSNEFNDFMKPPSFLGISISMV